MMQLFFYLLKAQFDFDFYGKTIIALIASGWVAYWVYDKSEGYRL